MADVEEILKAPCISPNLTPKQPTGKDLYNLIVSPRLTQIRLLFDGKGWQTAKRLTLSHETLQELKNHDTARAKKLIAHAFNFELRKLHRQKVTRSLTLRKWQKYRTTRGPRAFFYALKLYIKGYGKVWKTQRLSTPYNLKIRIERLKGEAEHYQCQAIVNKCQALLKLSESLPSPEPPNPETLPQIFKVLDETDKLTEYLKTYPKLSVRDGDGNTPLHTAINKVNPDAVKLLLAAGAPLNLTDTWGHTPLNLAIKKGNEDIVALFLQQENLDLETPDHQGYTPLMHAVTAEKSAWVEALLKRRPNLLASNHLNEHVFDIALHKKTDEILLLLLKELKQMPPTKPKHVPYIFRFFDINCPKIAHATMDLKPNLKESFKGETLLSALLKIDFTMNGEVFAAFLRGKPNLNQTNEFGHTLLHHAIRFERADCVSSLFKNGASPYQKTASGHTALQMILASNNPVLIATLYHVIPANTLLDGYRLLDHLILNGGNHEIETALEQGADPSLHSPGTGYTSLQLAYYLRSQNNTLTEKTCLSLLHASNLH